MEKLNQKQLRDFGLILGSGLIALFGIMPYFLHHAFKPWPYTIGAILLATAFIKPSLLKILHGPWMKVGAILGFINTRIILGLIFFILITPMAIFFRIAGKDAMSRRFDKSALTYRKKSKVSPIDHMERPFS